MKSMFFVVKYVRNRRTKKKFEINKRTRRFKRLKSVAF